MTASPRKKRLDQLVVEQGLAGSRERARTLIMAGQVLVNDILLDKPGVMVAEDARITCRSEDIAYVSRGGLKLVHALQEFRIDPTGWDCLDVGASTGGFTDCLLQHGAESVCAVDVGYGQLAWKLRQDPRVRVIERKNIRYISETELPSPFDLITIDVSFISLRIVVPAIQQYLKPSGHIIALIKPQFEAGKDQVGKGGVVRDASIHDIVINRLTHFFESECGLSVGPVVPSPILGPKGNREFLVLLAPGVAQ